MTFQKTVIVVAGGQGNRMQSELPKQFLLLGGKPILVRTIERFIEYDNQIHIILVLPEEHVHIWEEIAVEYRVNHLIDVVTGGETRYQSVQNGMKLVRGNGVVGIHDGVRPLVSLETISICYEHAFQTGNAIPGLPVEETLRKGDKSNTEWVDRNEYWTIQTPQCFKTEIIQNAYSQHFNPKFTDDASVVESIGQRINLVIGNRENLKITRPEDLELAEKLIGSR
ncbi:MAG: 2-C-methyl-D-erythritol 4-phosphate cytidylyltransferase [Crocinitomicaceae bacterium]|nr:2-C-methyl-D-erythritol 4-phosphate cytidylyltransferase [Crocinitomicaceae bacterium]|tara:strand:- start:5926 stop:6600 length:675 start_codon:yes stop_codon:yes gene_type:complete